MKCATVAALLGTLLVPGIVVGQGNTASLLDLTTNTVISNFVVGPSPQAVTWSGNSVAYVVNEDDNTLVRLDMTTSPPSINQTFTFASGFLPHAVAINAAGTRALVSGDGTSLYILNVSLSPFTIVDTIPVVADAGGVTYYASGTRAIVANESNILILDTTTVPAGITTVALGNQAHGVAVNAAGTRAAVSIDSGGLQVLDLTTNPPTLIGGLLGPVNADSLGVAISPDGSRAIYVDETIPASEANVVNLTGSPSLLAQIPLSILSPSAVAFNPVSGAALIAGDDGVSILNAPYTTVSATISHPGRRGAASYSLAVNPAGTRALVLHEDSLFCPYPIAFGDVAVGTTATRVETCINAGSGPSTVTAIAISGTGFAVNGVPVLPLVVPPGGTISFNVTFTPPGLGAQTGLLTVTTDIFSADVDTSGNGIATTSFVYKPLEPCRIMDTRSATAGSGVQGPIAGNSLKSLPGYVAAGQNWAQYGGNAASDCGLTNPPGGSIRAVALVATILNPNFDAYLGIGDTNNLSSVLSNVALNFTSGQGLSTMYLVPQIATNNIYFAMPAGLSAQVIFDVVGYHVLADATALECTTQASAPVSIGGSNGTGNATSPTCSSGYSLTGGSCDSTSASMSLAQDKATGGNTSWFCAAINRGVSAANLTATAKCCRVPGK